MPHRSYHSDHVLTSVSWLLCAQNRFNIMYAHICSDTDESCALTCRAKAWEVVASEFHYVNVSQLLLPFTSISISTVN